jgi:hypothetical protein
LRFRVYGVDSPRSPSLQKTVSSEGFRVQGSEFTVRHPPPQKDHSWFGGWDTWFSVHGSRFRVWGAVSGGKGWGAGCRVRGVGCGWVQGEGERIKTKMN